MLEKCCWMLALLAVLGGLAAWGNVQSQRDVIGRQSQQIEQLRAQLSQKNGQLSALSLLTEAGRRVQSRLYAGAENNHAQLMARKQEIEVLKRENSELRRWADTPLPADVVRLRGRPARTGGGDGQQLSGADAVPAGGRLAADERRFE